MIDCAYAKLQLLSESHLNDKNCEKKLEIAQCEILLYQKCYIITIIFRENSSRAEFDAWQRAQIKIRITKQKAFYCKVRTLNAVKYIVLKQFFSRHHT